MADENPNIVSSTNKVENKPTGKQTRLIPEKKLTEAVNYKVLEIFSGSGIFSETCRKRGWETYTVDNAAKHEPDLCADALTLGFSPGSYSLIWASVPCTGFSVCVISRNWEYGYKPKSETSIMGMRLLEHTIRIISVVKPTYWFIENPRGMMRKVIDGIFRRYGITGYRRVTVTYCKYGERRMKPTDIWTNNMHWIPRSPCRSGAACHDRQPRRYKDKIMKGALGKGTQGQACADARSILPRKLCEEIVEALFHG